MNIKQELYEIKSHFLLWFISLLLLTLFFCTFQFPLRTISHNNTVSTEKNTLVAYFFTTAKQNFLPKEVEIITLSPISVFLIQLKIGFLLSFAFLFPYFLYAVISYLSPALFPREKRALYLLITVSTLLFFSGIIFSYVYIVKSMFSFLFLFNESLGVKPLLLADEFINWSLAALFLSGSMFLFPVFMVIMSLLRIIKTLFWIRRWREVLILFLCIASLITPDVSGISLLLLLIPMTLLYSAGILFSYCFERKKKI